MLLEVAFRSSKRSKDLVQPYQSTASLIKHILDHIKEDQKTNFGSTRTIASYPCGLGMRLLIQFLSVSTDTIFQGPKVTHSMEHTSGNTRPH